MSKAAPAAPVDSVGHTTPSEVAFAQTVLGQRLLDALVNFAPSGRGIADFMLRNQVRITALGIEEMADSCGVSTATVSRFARDLGFKNFSAMRSAVADTLQTMLRPVDKLRRKIDRGHAAAPASDSMEHALANIRATMGWIDAAELARVVSVLSQARTVYVMGFGLSSHLAGVLAMHLQPFCRHVIEVAGHGGTEVAAGHLATITAKDVLVIISFPRYALDVLRLGRFARTRAACIVAVTDSPASPLAELAHHVLFAQSAHPVLPSSASAALCLIEALVTALMVSNKGNVAKAALLTDAISSYLYGSGEPNPTRSRKPSYPPQESRT